MEVVTININSSFDNFPIPEKTKPPEGGLSPKKQSDIPNGYWVSRDLIIRL